MVEKLKKVGLMILSCALCSIAVKWVALPNGFPVTGIAGISMVLENWTGINYAIIYYGITLLILATTFFVLGIAEVRSILFLSVLYPAVLWILNHMTISVVLEERLIAVALFGVLYGGGAGIVLRIGYSYGGMDTLSKILKKLFFKSGEIRYIMLGADSCIMFFMLTVFSLDKLAYAFVGQLITVNVMNYIIFNGPSLYDVQIIGEETSEIRRFMIEILHKSMTSHEVIGAYTDKTRIQMDCVCTSVEYVKLKEFIFEQKIECFIKVTPLISVFGANKDFRRLKDEIL